MNYIRFGIILFINIIINGCTNKNQTIQLNENSAFIGDWYFEYPVGDSIYNYTASYWGAHDPLRYSFYPDGILIISGGPEPLEDIRCKFYIENSSMGTDSVLNVIGCDNNSRFTACYEIYSINSDTIWMCEYDKSSDIRFMSDYCFLVKCI